MSKMKPRKMELIAYLFRNETHKQKMFFITYYGFGWLKDS
jgi:hypothetical protein